MPYSGLEKFLFVFDGEDVDIEPAVKFSRKAPCEVSDSDVRDYLYHLAEKRNASASTLNIAINALKFYYGEVLRRGFTYEIKRPKKDKKLPVVLSQEEVSRIFIICFQHQALIYSAGLRVGEVEG